MRHFLALTFAFASIFGTATYAADGNRLTYLDENNPWYPHLNFPKLITPQWVGEEGVDCVVVLAIDDMREPAKYEAYLRPILNRLKKIDGRAPLSIMTCNVKPDDPQLKQWLDEGLSFEVHTVDHPCPLLAGGDFAKAKSTYDRCVDLLNEIPGNKPVAFRMPCCDSLNTLSPRFYAEIFGKTTPKGNFLALSSSVFNIFTSDDPAIPRELVIDADGRDKFLKYIPKNLKRGEATFNTFVNTIQNYPYPYVINRLCWEFPCVVPSDWEAQHLQKPNNPDTVRDMKAALDITVLKQGVYCLVFHPHGWIQNTQVVELIDHAVAKHGKKVKFLNFREAAERLNKNLLDGTSLRDEKGEDRGVRLFDVNHDGYQDTFHWSLRPDRFYCYSRIWYPSEREWWKASSPSSLIDGLGAPSRRPIMTMPRFGWLHPNHSGPSFLPDNFRLGFAHTFAINRWDSEEALRSVRTSLLANGIIKITEKFKDAGTFTLRDIDGNGTSEIIFGNEKTSAIVGWSEESNSFKPSPFALPTHVVMCDAHDRDVGLRFVDLNEDGHDDIVFSNAERYGIWLFEDMKTGWSRKVLEGKRSDPSASGRREPAGNAAGKLTLPPIVRADGSDNGFFVHSRHLFWQNEDTDTLPDLVDRRSFGELLAQAELPPRAKSPEGALKSFQVRPGFQIELVVAEPLTMDPVAFEWGADGKLWVVEMADYPLGIDAKGKPGGRVRFLEDTDGDGKYDKSTVFLEGVPYPTGVLPWRKGVLVTAAPDIFYAEDTNGDGKADKREVLFTGFVEGNQQHRVNGLVYGLDNWVYCANGDSGGGIRSLRGLVTGRDGEASAEPRSKEKASSPNPARPEPRPPQTVNISGRDVRIRPDTGDVEAITGQTQFGRNRDDWGNWFGCNNSNPMYQFVLDDHYQRRNPHFAALAARVDVPKAAGNAPVFPISRTVERFNDFHTANRFTSACSAMIYRDELFGPQYAGTMFVSEPVHNLVHREPVRANGVTFTSERAADEQQSEFLASTDNWFRPTMIKAGPDGALWIADMYRHVIEHPQWIPDTWQKRLDLRAGHDKGRIYRVTPVGVKTRPFKRLDTLDAAGLVAALDSPSGWQRDTAQRLLIERFHESRGTGDSPVSQLENVVTDGKNPLARLHALCVLDGLHALTTPVLLKSLTDEHPGVRRHAVRLSETLVAKSPTAPRSNRGAADHPEALSGALIRLTADADPHVRMQLAYTLGEIDDSRAGRALGELLAKVGSDRFLYSAAMSSIGKKNVEQVLVGVLANRGSGAPNLNLIEGLLNMAAALGNDKALVTLLTDVTTPRDGKFEAWQFAAVGGLLDTLDRQRKPLAKLAESPDEALRTALKQLAGLFAAARKSASEGGADETLRVTAIRLLGRGLEAKDDDLKELTKLLSPQTAPELQDAAVTTLGRLNEPRVAELFLENWRGFGPDRRGQVLDLLLSREAWQERVLVGIEKQVITAADFDAARRQRLLEHRSENVRARAAKLLATTVNADRQKVIDQFRSALESDADPARGAQLFAKTCAQCHKLKDVGYEVGPDLASLTDKSPESLLVAVLDPNRAVEAKYLNYTALTKAGISQSGLLAAESGNSITLRGPEGKEQTILRADLDELVSTSKSTMPEGLEKDLKPRDVADIIAHVRANVPLPVRREFDGNTPALVKQASDGSLLLTAANGEIYGSTLVFEPQYKNLGWWSSLDDHAVWSVDVSKPGRFTVEFDYACDRSVAEINPWRLDAGKNSLTGKVASTGNWDTYAKTKVGEIELSAGKQRIVLRPAKRIQGAMIDLRGIRLARVK